MAKIELTPDRSVKSTSNLNKPSDKPQLTKNISHSADANVLKWREEMDSYYKLMETFDSEPVDEVMRALASMTSRFSQIRSWIVRSESRAGTHFRTKEVDPFIEECDRQFKIWSRILSVQSMDWELSRRDGM